MPATISPELEEQIPKVTLADPPELNLELERWARTLPARRQVQTTLASPSPWLRGREPQSGQPVSLQLHPAPPGTGIAFTTDRSLGGARRRPGSRQTFPATISRAFCADICLAVGGDRARITHIEHLLATLLALGVDNAFVLVRKATFHRDLVDRRAVPILASATVGFARLIHAAGIVAQGEPRRLRTLRRSFEAPGEAGRDRVLAEPLEDPTAPLRVRYSAGYPDLGVEDRTFEVEIRPDTFLRELSQARTMLGQLNSLPLPLARILGCLAFPGYGLGLGVNPENTLAPLQGRILGGARFGSPGEELVRHKIVDFLGAVALLGPLAGIRFTVTKSGHRNDLQALRELEPRLQACTRLAGGRTAREAPRPFPRAASPRAALELRAGA